jgi:hypothetical protein
VGTLCVQYEWRRRGASGDCVAHAERGNDGNDATIAMAGRGRRVSNVIVARYDGLVIGSVFP